MKDIVSEIDDYLRILFPVHRSITGEGNRETLRILQELIPIRMIEYPSGQQVFDWTIPQEWIIRDAWIKGSNDKKIVNYRNSNLHVVSYSRPIHKKISQKELFTHLHFLEDLPEAIPYRTSYYKENWGFCVSYNDFQRYFSNEDNFEVYIDSEFKNGSLSVGELLIKGESAKEYLISTYLCHPSMANDNLSGVILTAMLARELMHRKLNYSYRFVFLPETIGAIAYCANNQEAMKKIDAGFVITNVGGPGKHGYKQSWHANHPINQIIESTFRENEIDFITYSFNIHGSDERQYSSGGFRINAASITKDKYYEYDYYHTSLDNLDFVKPEYINESLQIYIEAIEKLDKNIIYENIFPNCEVMLSKHGLYPQTGGGLLPDDSTLNELDLTLWLLFYCDGQISLFEIAEKLGIDIHILYTTAEKLFQKNLLKRCDF